jgi:hypothetical protein
LGAAHNADAPAIKFLPNASPDDTPIVITHGQFVERVTQAANIMLLASAPAMSSASCCRYCRKVSSRYSAPRQPALPIP